MILILLLLLSALGHKLHGDLSVAVTVLFPVPMRMLSKYRVFNTYVLKRSG